MIGTDPYAIALRNLGTVNFEGDRPWEGWSERDVTAIETFFQQPKDTTEITSDSNAQRNSNVEGGRLLFVLSQREENPYLPSGSAVTSSRAAETGESRCR